MASPTRSRRSASAAAAAGRRRAASAGSRTASQRSPATASASSTVSVGNRRASWNERPRPAHARWCGAHPVTSTPASRTRPSSGATKPLMTSNSVVLPAPLAPISPTISPGCTVSVTSSMAVTPPNRRRTSTTSRAGGSSPPVETAGRRPELVARRSLLRCRSRRRSARTSGWSRNAAASPSHRTSPFTTTTARSARSSATPGRLLDEHDRRPRGGPRRDQRRQLPGDDGGCQPERELVDHQQPGPGDHGHAERQQLLLAARQLGRRRRRPLGQDGKACVDRRRGRPGRRATRRRRGSRRRSAIRTRPRRPGSARCRARRPGAAARRASGRPSKSISPALGRTRPAIVRASVVLPAPLGPSTATTSPSPTVRSIPNSTCVGPYPASTSRTDSNARAAVRRSPIALDAPTQRRRLRRQHCVEHAGEAVRGRPSARRALPRRWRPGASSTATATRCP